MSVNEAYGSKKAVISILNSMASSSFEIALDQHVLRGINYLDLKDCIWEKSIVELTVDEARKVSQIIKRRSLSVYCLSTVLFDGDIELGQSYFQSNYFDRLNHLIEIAKIFQPRFIRLLAAKTVHRSMISHSVDYLQQKYNLTYLSHFQSFLQLVVIMTCFAIYSHLYIILTDTCLSKDSNINWKQILNRLLPLVHFVGFMLPIYFIMLAYYLSSTVGYQQNH